jgi:hypothetical protein
MKDIVINIKDIVINIKDIVIKNNYLVIIILFSLLNNVFEVGRKRKIITIVSKIRIN